MPSACYEHQRHKNSTHNDLVNAVEEIRRVADEDVRWVKAFMRIELRTRPLPDAAIGTALAVDAGGSTVIKPSAPALEAGRERTHGTGCQFLWNSGRFSTY